MKDENMLQLIYAVMDILQYFVEDDDAPYVSDERFLSFKEHMYSLMYNLKRIKEQDDD